MKKHTFYMVALLLAGAVMTACSGGDDMTSDITSEPQPSAEAGDVELSGTLGSKGDVTRAINAYGYGTWEVGDKFAVYYQTANGNATTTATVNSVNSNDGSANFTAVLHNPKAGDNDVTLVYPFSAHNGEGGFKTDALMSQEGTLDYINTKGLDIETATTTMKVEGMNATLTENVTMKPQVCLYKMKIQDDESHNLTTKKLEIREGTHTYTITPTTPDYILTMALLPIESSDFSITATTTGEINTYTKRDGVTLTNCTAENVGDVFDEGGYVYSVSKVPAIYSKNYSGKTLEAGKFYSGIVSLSISSTPIVGMIAYVGDHGTVDDSSTDAQTGFRGLALAMKNISEGNTREYKWCDQSSNYCTDTHSNNIEVARGWKNGITMTTALVNHGSHTNAHSAAVKARNYGVNYSVSRPTEITSDWFLPSLGQWQLILQGLITKGEGNSYSTPIGDYYDNEGSNFNKGTSSFYSILDNAGAQGIYLCNWSSSEYSSGSAWCLVVNENKCSAFGDGKIYGHTVRPVIAF